LSGARTVENSENWINQTRARLALRRAEKPATKAGQIRALWPDIEAALTGGQSMKSIRKWLEQDAGITLGITSLTSYISRIRRREMATRFMEPPKGRSVRAQTRAESVLASSGVRPSIEALPGPTLALKPPDDPLAQAMRALSSRAIDIREIHSDGDPRGRKLI
jgi:hypothetical protein